MKTLLFTLFAAICLIPDRVEAAGLVEANPPSVTLNARWKWELDKVEGAYILTMSVGVKLPPGSSFRDLKFEKGSKLVTQGPQTFEILMPGTTEVIQGVSVGGKPTPITLKLSPLKNPVIEYGCSQQSLRLTLEKPMPPGGYIGFFCLVNPQTKLIGSWITAPQDAEWGSSTLFEVSGKGERWKMYRVNQVDKSISDVVTGTLNLELAGKPLVINLVKTKDAAMSANTEQLKINKAKAERLEQENQKLKTQVKEAQSKQAQKRDESRPISFSGGLGLGLIGVKGPDGSVSAPEPLLMLSVKTVPVFLGMGVGGSAKFALALSSTSGVNYNDFFGWIGPTFGTKSVIDLKLGLLTMGTDESVYGISFRHTDLAIAPHFRFIGADGSWFWFEPTLSGYVPKGLSSYLSIGLGYAKRGAGAVTWSYGGYYQATTYSTNGASFSQMLFSVQAHY